MGSQAKKDADLDYVHWVKETKDAGKPDGPSESSPCSLPVTPDIGPDIEVDHSETQHTLIKYSVLVRPSS